MQKNIHSLVTLHWFPRSVKRCECSVASYNGLSIWVIIYTRCNFFFTFLVPNTLSYYQNYAFPNQTSGHPAAAGDRKRRSAIVAEKREKEGKIYIVHFEWCVCGFLPLLLPLHSCRSFPPSPFRPFVLLGLYGLLLYGFSQLAHSTYSLRRNT